MLGNVSGYERAQHHASVKGHEHIPEDGADALALDDIHHDASEGHEGRHESTTSEEQKDRSQVDISGEYEKYLAESAHQAPTYDELHRSS